MSIDTISLAQIKPSPFNPRKTFDRPKLDELAASIKSQGVLQPILVRPNGSGYELVLGERRLRASKLAGLEEVPAVVRAMLDDEVVEAQVVENDQREDVSPLEEADGYQMLVGKFGRSVDDVAAKVGRSRAYVYARLKLCDLGKEGRKALIAGELTPATALLVARIPTSLQKDAVGALALDWRGVPVSAREAARIVRERFMLRLKGAPFNPKDAALVPAAGACGDCPKRTGNQAELFGDVDSADVCTDPTCFGAKSDAAWAIRAEEERAKGVKVIDGTAAAKLVDEYRGGGGYLRHGAAYVALDREEWIGSKHVKLRSLVPKKDPPPVTLIRSPNGTVVQAIAKADADRLLRREKGSARHRGQTLDSAGARNKAKNDVARRVANLAMAALVARAVNRPHADIWRLIARAQVEHTWHDALKAIVRRRELDKVEEPPIGVEPKKGRKKKPKPAHPEELLKREIESADEAVCRGLVVELALARSAYTGFGPYSSREDKTLFKAWGVDVEKLEREERAAVKMAAAAKKAKKKSPTKKRSARAGGKR
jgi:ParB/RepB/Spo0J family partition protein